LPLKKVIAVAFIEAKAPAQVLCLWGTPWHIAIVPLNRESGAHWRVQLDPSNDVPSEDDGPRSAVRPLNPEATTVRQVQAARPFFSTVPIVILAAEQLSQAPIDARAGFILSLVDGRTSVEELLDISAMPAEETLALLDDLRLRGIIEFR
jgi:hypothetical protein